jgi:hypothetical protein
MSFSIVACCLSSPITSLGVNRSGQSTKWQEYKSGSVGHDVPFAMQVMTSNEKLALKH